MFQIQIKNQNLHFENSEKGFTINQKLVNLDIFELQQKNSYHILHENQSYLVDVLKADYTEKNFLVKINGNVYEINAKNNLDLLLSKMGMDKITHNKTENLKAPMPGLIVEVKVSEGQSVKKGEPILVLEAMKMENILKAPNDVTIKNIKIKKGENVEKNQILIEF
ncbi:MAG: acetyl-CoA carboxylase biotin carboxyl carrier protein subunit [Cytophagia bacterium]|nr:MAG: acetyl-CoA carboxylase biotin carboxyl carrier protein subunit [Cytophagales bacterium]TAG01713.1 MAG: acetyl-CoA carboxylase biotin carboxyl carrier protein subunit [Cytophagia bacterium]TAG38992.1 MAG: acetyl-CoA carboxylase biotin carboxyl carrier protein subunit [Cytophagia bacterium]TAH30500.1 MAG: acetyl-CoA carboxylase biotin carboxyl carrier protein subunit [Cytophagales bacterium]